MAWDLWIETTMNKGSKLKSSWLSILNNEKQLLVHSRNVNNIDVSELPITEPPENELRTLVKKTYKHTWLNGFIFFIM